MLMSCRKDGRQSLWRDSRHSSHIYIGWLAVWHSGSGLVYVDKVTLITEMRVFVF